MRTLKWLIFVVCLAISKVIAVNTLISNHPFEEAFALPRAFAQQPADPGPPSTSRSPRFVSVQMKKQLETLIAGETGRFELEARLKTPEDPSETVPLWDRNVTTPLAIWIASPDNSGIAFIDKHFPDRPHQHILVKFALPAEPDSQPLTAVVEYRVNSRTVSGKHTFWLDIYAELTTTDGNKIQDMGNIRLPFEVDTHLRTKLLMLTVIAAAIFFFIVEWVRVDVVAMAMMVLLPELGLLNARDTFKGLSSNAVETPSSG